jgi:hypothetical protein
MESNTNDEEAPKDPGAMKALTNLQDNDIFGKWQIFHFNVFLLIFIRHTTTGCRISDCYIFAPITSDLQKPHWALINSYSEMHTCSEKFQTCL